MGVNKVEVNGETILDLTSSTVTPETLSEGVTAFNAAGDPITGTQTAVQYGKAQSLTEAQKTQARSNIGAVTLEEVIDSIKVEYPEAHVIYGDVDSSNIITIFGDLADGTYTLKYENEDGTVTEIGNLVVGENVVVYTNYIPISTDDNGNIYNGKGFKEGVRYSTSSKAESALDGAYLSGIIPVANKDVIYLKNVSINANNPTNYNNVVFFNDSKTTVWNMTVDQLKAECSAVVDSNGIVTQFAISAGIGFIRINASYIGTDSILQINDPIV